MRKIFPNFKLLIFSDKDLLFSFPSPEILIFEILERLILLNSILLIEPTKKIIISKLKFFYFS